MKETVITPKQKKRELIILLFCFIAAFLLNVIGIIKFGSPAKELVTELHLVLLVAAVLYVISGIFRILYGLISRLWKH